METDQRESTTPTSASTNSVILPLNLNPTLSERVHVGIEAFFVAPLAILILSVSLNSMLYWAAKGQPLSSTEGVLGLVISALLFFAIGLSAVRTSIGIAVTAGWAATFSIAAGAVAMIFDSPVSLLSNLKTNFAVTALQLIGPSAWSGLPSMIFAISASATLATWIARESRRQEIRPSGGSHLRLSPGLLNGDADWFAAPGSPLSPSRTRVHIGVLIADLVFGVLAWVSIMFLAPTDISAVAVHGALALTFQQVSMLPLLGVIFAFTLLSLSTGWSTLGNLITSVFLFIMPGLLLIPVVTSLAGTVATPGDATSTSLALASPVMAACGLVSLALTSGIHWVRTAPHAGD